MPWETRTEFSESERRWFGLLLGAFAVAVAARLAIRDATGLAAITIGGTSVLLFIYFAVPSSQAMVLRGWMKVTAPIGMAISFLLLTAIFFCVVTPLGLALRLVGKSPLRSVRSRLDSSAWIPRRQRELADYFRQF
jgi:CBS-domain-containing membrane protein